MDHDELRRRLALVKPPQGQLRRLTRQSQAPPAMAQQRIRFADGSDHPVHDCLQHAQDRVHGPHLHGFRGPVGESSWREELAWCEGVLPHYGFLCMDDVEAYLE